MRKSDGAVSIGSRVRKEPAKGRGSGAGGPSLKGRPLLAINRSTAPFVVRERWVWSSRPLSPNGGSWTASWSGNLRAGKVHEGRRGSDAHR